MLLLLLNAVPGVNSLSKYPRRSLHVLHLGLHDHVSMWLTGVVTFWVIWCLRSSAVQVSSGLILRFLWYHLPPVALGPWLETSQLPLDCPIFTEVLHQSSHQSVALPVSTGSTMVLFRAICPCRVLLDCLNSSPW